MARFLITDPAIGASYGEVEAPSQQAALDFYARIMGWEDYADYEKVAARFAGMRTLEAEEVFVLELAEAA